MSESPEKLRAQADKAASSAGAGFGWFGSKTDKYENAASLYTQAANGYRIQKNGKEAGQCFELAARIHGDKLNEPNDMAQAYIDAAKAYRQTDPEDSARAMSLAVDHYLRSGNFRRAASYKEQLAELYETSIGDVSKARAAYEDAAGWYEDDNAQALANKLFLKAADLAALDKEYPTAIAKYEKVAKTSVNNNLMKYSVKDYLLKAGICHLAMNDQVGTERALEQYQEIDPQFAGLREFQLLSDLSAAVKDGDVDVFSEKLFQYDQVSKLDSWKTKMLLRYVHARERSALLSVADEIVAQGQGQYLRGRGGFLMKQAQLDGIVPARRGDGFWDW